MAPRHLATHVPLAARLNRETAAQVLEYAEAFYFVTPSRNKYFSDVGLLFKPTSEKETPTAARYIPEMFD